MQRWKEEIVQIGQFGRGDSTPIDRREQLNVEKGQQRLEGTQAIKETKGYIISRMKEIGLDVRLDAVGNIFGRREGSKTQTGAVMSGSHLDSVLSGGMFDGIVGVVSALEALRIMNDEGFANERPIELAIFTGEEGSAFKKGLLGSSVLVGHIAVDDALALQNDEGRSLRAVLDQQELRGDFQIDFDEIEYFIETHVEQGPVLDQERTPIGIVENITGITWVTAIIEGEANHAGTTPMLSRKDALVASADVASFVNKRAIEMVREFGGSTVATVGKMVVHPGAPNIVPGKVELGIDIRDGDQDHLNKLTTEIIDFIKKMEGKYGVKCSTEIPIDHPPCPCASEVVTAIEKATRQMGIKAKRMNSGAGHDAQNIAEKVKTGMLFVPSINGISHSPMEWTEWEDIEKGIQVLSLTMKTLSQLSA